VTTGRALPSGYAGLSALEWLETNGLGGYASGTAAGASTRRYHGWLVAASRPPAERTMLITGADEWLELDPIVELSTHQYPGAVAPDGYRLLEAFTTEPFPTWTYRTPTHRVERRLFMVQGRNATVVRYQLLEGAPVMLGVRPFVVFRGHHDLRHASDGWSPVSAHDGESLRWFSAGDGPSLSVWMPGGRFRDDPEWYRDFEYLRELDRGLPFREDAFAPGVIELPLEVGRDADLVFSAGSAALDAAATLESRERDRRSAFGGALPVRDQIARGLARAAAAFPMVRSGGERSVIAGYPWFTDWGRDTMIALPGLVGAALRPEEAAAILDTFAAHARRGLVPNRFPDAGTEPEYNSVDASLWFIVAVFRLLEAGGAAAPVGETLMRAVEQIVDSYTQGTDFGIREDRDGLISAGADGLALTWMDARVGDWVVTPRRGKPVEVNALWYNARRILAELHARRGRTSDARAVRLAADVTRRAFVAAFWDRTTGSLVDVIGEDGTPDRAVRPNQVFAAALPFPLLTRPRARSMLTVVDRELVTPRGLRSLAPSDPAYRGRYEGDVSSRDGAYHQGTVWPWLIGPYADAVRYAFGPESAAATRVRAVLRDLATTDDVLCPGQLPELYDGDAPRRPCGCIAQAWSVAEVLRVWATQGTTRASRRNPRVRRSPGPTK